LGMFKYMVQREAGYIVKCIGGVEGIKKHKQAGAVLWLGLPPVSAETKEGQKDATFEAENMDLSTIKAGWAHTAEGPSPYTFTDHRRHPIPVFNLQSLLGEDYVQHLREYNELFRGEMAIVRNKGITHSARLWLWKLMGFNSGSGAG